MPQAARTVVWITVIGWIVLCAAGSAHGQPAGFREEGPVSDSIPLAPPGGAPERGKDAPHSAGKLDLSAIVTVGSSLAVVLGLFLVVAWVMRRTTPGNCPTLTSEVFEVLGRAPLVGRQQVHLVRLGAKLVLLSISPTGVETLSEVTDPDEVSRLAGLCQKSRSDSATAMFRQVFQRFSKDRSTGHAMRLVGGGREGSDG